MTIEGGGSGRLTGQVALVTGAARNIGAAVAWRLALEGAAVAVNHRTSGDADAVALVERIRAAGGRAASFAADVGDEEQVRGMLQGIHEQLGTVDILVNNAAAAVAGRPAWNELSVDDWDEVMRTNVTGAFVCARAVHPDMAARGRGRMIAMSSVRVPIGLPGNAHYTSSKAALLGMTRVLARELGPAGITVNSIIVGAIRTPAEAAYGAPEEVDRTMLELQSIKRRGTPDDIAGCVAFLATDDASFITGQSITVDGGWVML